jgi:23S rRNA (pseudouridine1915-N3)-methyltransferase
LMSKDGELVTTEKLLDICKNKNMVFIIWWPYGLNEDELVKIWSKRIAFGKITLPHWLAKLTLLEQIYRIWTIESGKSYHY